MSVDILRVGVYWFPPRELCQVLTDCWQGVYNRFRSCELLARHCGDCPIWGSHMTLLDAVSIDARDRNIFKQEMFSIISEYFPLVLESPQLTLWGDNLFIATWSNPDSVIKVSKMREKMMTKAAEFVLREVVSWEAVNNLERTIQLLGEDNIQPAFLKGWKQFLSLLKEKPLPLIHAPNIPLEWYILSLGAGRPIREGCLPFPPRPHISLATAVRDDSKYGFSAAEVGRCVFQELPQTEPWKKILDSQNKFFLDTAYLVEPEAPSKPPLDVTVLDKITGKPRHEKRNRWLKKEALVSGGI